MKYLYVAATVEVEREALAAVTARVAAEVACPVRHIGQSDNVSLFLRRPTDVRRQHPSDGGENPLDSRATVCPTFVGLGRIDHHRSVGFEEQKISGGTRSKERRSGK